MKETQSGLFLASLVVTIWFLAGKRWVWALLPVIGFLIFCLPIWTSVIDRYTLSMQHASANMAVQILQIVGLHPLRTDETTVYLDNFTLTVAAACSGAKLTLALMAFTAFFMLTRQAKVWANVALVAILIPFCLFVNGIRIAMVGVVGNAFGDAAGRSFHDWGGYIALVICFVLLSSITKVLGYK
jgi:exosortase